MDGVTILESEVRELIRRRGLDPLRDPAAVRELVVDAVADYDARSLLGGVPPLGDTPGAIKLLVDTIAGLGPLQRYLDDPEIEEIWINGPAEVFVARGGEHELTTTILTDQQVRDLVEQMLKTSGRRLDLSSPFVDATLPTGERVHAVIPDVTRRHWAVNIRKYIVRADRLDALVNLGSLTAHAARFLDAAVEAGLNILVAGATQAGKTTMLNALAGAVPAKERIITCEEVFELAYVSQTHMLGESRPRLHDLGSAPRIYPRLGRRVCLTRGALQDVGTVWHRRTVAPKMRRWGLTGGARPRRTSSSRARSVTRGACRSEPREVNVRLGCDRGTDTDVRHQLKGTCGH